MDGNSSRAGRRTHVEASRKALSAVLAASMALSAPGLPAFADARPDGGYDDVSKGAWYYESVMDATDKGLMSGYGGTYLFGPENNLLRAEMAQLLANASDVETAPGASDATGLADLAEPAWYTASVNWAFAKGLLKGYSLPGDDLFGPEDPLTREQAMVVLQRWAETRGADPNAYGEVAKEFPDWDSVSAWAQEAVEWAVERDLVDGTESWSGTTLDPQRPVLRSEMAKMIANAEDVIRQGWLNVDTDGDGEADLNVDTDGDGKPDLNVDPDHDGAPDLNVDTDGDGKPDLNVDTDGDGEPDVNIDTDGDGVADESIDEDGNGVADEDEKPSRPSGPSAPPVNVDTDGDGKPDLNVDTDGDGKADLNVDTDGDGKPDLNVDTSDPADGQPDLNVDTDGDRLPEVNVDTDGDGEPEISLDANHDGKEDVDIDTSDPADGVPDIDLDTDGDGKADVNLDLDGDGKPDLNVDTDGDGKPDLNVDDDGDFRPDSNVDEDGDGVADFSVSFDLPATAHTDTTITVVPSVAGAFDVEWTLEKDGSEVSFDEAVNGTLNVGGGEITFKNSGTYVLTGTAKNAEGATAFHRETIAVYPVASVDVQAASMTHVDEQVDVKAVLENADGLEVVWTVLAGDAATGTPATEEQVAGVSALVGGEGVLRFVQAGTYTVVATVTDETGRSWSDSQAVTSYPVGGVGVAAPAWVHTDEDLLVEATFDNLGSATPSWSVAVDGQEKDWGDVFDGELGPEGGTVRAKVDGDMTITASFVDPAGREYESSCEVKVYPVPQLSYSLPADAWTDSQIQVSVVGSGLDDVEVEWLVDNTYGYQDWATYVDGELSNDGGTIRFKRAGTYEIVARVTDATGRVFLFEMDDATTVVQPVLDLSFDLPEETYVGDVCKVRTKGDNGWLPVSWTLKKDGAEASLVEWMGGSLNALGGDVSFLAPGVYELTAVMEDVDGREFSHSDVVTVHPNVEFDLTVDGSDGTGEDGNTAIVKHLGEQFTVAVDSANLEGASVVWSVEGRDGAAAEWDDLVDGELGLDGGSVSFKGAAGDWALVATVTDAYGKSTEWRVPVTSYNEAPSAPSVQTSVDLYDSTGAFTAEAKVKATAVPSAVDAWEGDVVTYEWEAGGAVAGDSGYYGLGSHAGRVRAVDQWGAASEWTDVEIVVQLSDPAAPTITPTVDYADMTGAFTDDAKVKVAFDVANNADQALTKAEMATEDGYFGLGENTATAVVTDLFGRKTESSSTFEVENDAPAAPAVSATVDYSDAKDAFTASAKARVVPSATAGADRDETRVEWAEDSALDAEGGYLGVGVHALKARTVDAFGAESDWTTVNVNLGVVGEADPAGTVYAAPTAQLSSSTLGSGDATTSSSVNFTVATNGATPVEVRTIDYYDQNVTFKGEAGSGAQSTTFDKAYGSGRHLLVAQARDFFGNAGYDSRFFIVGSTTAGGGAEIASQTTSIAEAGVFDGDTALAYIDSFTFDIPSISGHSSGDSDWIEVYGTKLDGSEVKLVHFNSNSGKAHIDASGGTARWTSDGSPTSGSFSYPAGTYVKLRFVYYNDHPNCLDNATEGLSYSVGYTFREESGLEESFGNLFDW